MIPMFKPDTGQHELQAIKGVAKSGSFILGKQVSSFENNFASYIGAQYAVGVASGTDALILSLEALGIGEGDEVIVPAFSFYATAEAVSRVRATPVFVDIDREYNIDPSKVEITKNTKAIIAVHNYGRPADIHRLRKFNVPIIVDSAQALTKHQGLIGCYSFFPTKPLGGCGDGGMVVTNDYRISAQIRQLRVHGQKKRWEFIRVGYNSRLDAIQAAYLSVKLTNIEKALKKRKSLAARYNRKLMAYVATPKHHVRHSWGVYTIESDNRDVVKNALRDRGIESAIHYPTALPDLLVYRHEGDWPIARAAAERVLSLPIYPGLTKEEQNRIIEVVKIYG